MSIGRDARSIHKSIPTIGPSRMPHGCSVSRHRSASTLRSCRTMTSDANRQLWRRGLGIRFASQPKSTTLYPTLDLARFVHHSSSATASDGTKSASQIIGERYGESPSTEISQWAHCGEPQVATGGPTGQGESAGDPIAANKNEPSTPRIGQVNPPPSSLPFSILLEKFREARESPKGSPRSYWSHTMYHKSEDDGTTRNVKVHYCTSKHTMEFVCQKYFKDQKVLGFDLEWSPRATKNMGTRQNVSLIQLASPGRIGLFHCAVFPKDDFVAPTFKDIMEDASISKVGVAIKADCTRLGNYLGVETRGIFELSHLYKVVKYTKERRPAMINKSLVPLATLVEECLGLPLFKGETVRGSDWTQYLNSRQIQYSASDAYAGIQLYYTLDEERRKLDPIPDLPHHAELGLPLPIPTLGEKEEEGRHENTENSDSPSPEVQGDSANAAVAPKDELPKFRDQRIAVAHYRMLKYRESKKGPVSVGPAALRAYYIWYTNDDLGPGAIAELLRDPPLQTNTVVSYILSAVTDENLPYNKARARDELLASLKPEAMKATKYQALRKACEEPPTPDTARAYY